MPPQPGASRPSLAPSGSWHHLVDWRMGRVRHRAGFLFAALGSIEDALGLIRQPHQRAKQEHRHGGDRSGQPGTVRSWPG